MRVLHAWLRGQPVGTFTQDAAGRIGFSCDGSAVAPISLSPPLEGGWHATAPANFLNNLLPESPVLRQMMAERTGARSTDVFDLLDSADSAGGIVFSSADTLPTLSSDPAPKAGNDAIASQIWQLRAVPEQWWASSPRARFSLAGNQPKFTLARLGGQWYWPNAAIASTHILKPSASGRPDVDVVEAASNRLARPCGMDVPEAGLAVFGGEETYIVERFDRLRRADGSVERIHSEDLLQSFGLPSARKYDVTAKMVLSLLHSADPSDGLSYEWIRRLAFNVSIGNADAHAKNYSIILDGESIRLSPMYGLLTTIYWPSTDPGLAMRVGGARDARGVRRENWRSLAAKNGLDPDKVEHIAVTTGLLVLENAWAAYDPGETGIPGRIGRRAVAQISEANKSLLPEHARRLRESVD